MFVYGVKATLTIFCDASFGASDNPKYKSNTCVIVMLSNGRILRSKWIQGTFCCSRTDEELIPMYEATKETVFIRKILMDLDLCTDVHSSLYSVVYPVCTQLVTRKMVDARNTSQSGCT